MRERGKSFFPIFTHAHVCCVILLHWKLLPTFLGVFYSSFPYHCPTYMLVCAYVCTLCACVRACALPVATLTFVPQRQARLAGPPLPHQHLLTGDALVKLAVAVMRTQVQTLKIYHRI